MYGNIIHSDVNIALLCNSLQLFLNCLIWCFPEMYENILLSDVNIVLLCNILQLFLNCHYPFSISVMVNWVVQ